MRPNSLGRTGVFKLNAALILCGSTDTASAIRMCLDWLVTGHVTQHNPSASVRAPKYVVKRGKTPVLTACESRQLLDSIKASENDGTPDVVGLCDRALIGVMVFSFARVGAVVRMNVEDYQRRGRRSWFRLHEKGGKFHEVPAHHTAEEYVDAYVTAAEIEMKEKKSPLFRSAAGKSGELSDARMNRVDVLRMIKRRSAAAGMSSTTCCHTFRTTGITAYLENGGTVEKAQAIAAHESPRTTKLYDRTSDVITLDEVERVRI